MPAVGVLAALMWRLVAPAPGDSQWTVTPAAPTVGDTVWLTRTVSLGPEWRVKAAPFDNQGDVIALADPEVRTNGGTLTLRYAVVVWTPGTHDVNLPTLWLIGAGGRTDSLPGGSAVVTVRSVIPQDSTHPAPKALLPPLDSRGGSWWPPAAASAVSLVLLAVGVRMRRRGPRAPVPAAEFVTGTGAPDDRWLDAGEPKAVAVRATRLLRRALAVAVPEAPESVPVREALEAAEGRMPGATFRRLRETLLALDQVAFAAAHGVDVAQVAAEARALAGEL